MKVEISSTAPKEWNSGIREFYQKVSSKRIKTTNPVCQIEFSIRNDPFEKGPDLLIEFEDGRKLEWKNASYLPLTSICDAVRNKKDKIKYFYRQIEKEFHDSDDEDYIGLHDKEKKGGGGGGGGAKGGKGGGGK